MHLRLGLVMSAALLAGGCSWFSWLPWVDKEVDADAPAELSKYQPELKIDRLWGAGIGEGLGTKYVRLSPAVVADRVIAADAYGYVEARERFKGKRIWKARIGRTDEGFFSFLNVMDRRDPSFVSGGVGAGEGLVLIGTTHAEVIALAVADGKEQWRTRVSSEVLAAPTTGEGHVFAQTSDGRLVALAANGGAQLWTFDTQVPVLTLRGTGSPAYASGFVVAGFANGKVGAFRAATGEPTWEQRVMLPQGRSELDRIVDVDGAPLITAAAIFAASYQGRVKALRPADGTVFWERETSTSVDLAQGRGHIYVVDDKDVVTALDQRNGNVVWEQRGLFRRELSPPVAFGDYVAVADGEGYVHVLAQSDGRFLARRKVDGKGVRSAMNFADDVLYVYGNGGKLAALSVKPIAKRR
jgi:outer membrane protein assembly factor BamB